MKNFQGKVVSDKMEKTAVVLVERIFRHPMYGKVLKRNKKIHCRNLIGAKQGDIVKIVQTRLMAKTVSFAVAEIVKNKNSKKETKE